MPRRAVPQQRFKAPQRKHQRPVSRTLRRNRNPSFNASTVYTVTATNVGTVATNPTITVTGPATPTTLYFENITEGKVLWVNVTVGAGHTLVIDFGARTITLDGTVQSGVLTVASRWWDLQPGTNSLRSNVVAAVTFRPAYSS